MEYEEATIRVGISSCLLGEKVRWNGDHKEDHYVTGTLAQFFEWVAVCPEVEIGLGTPRETIHLVGDPETPRLKTTSTDIDLTNQMLKYAGRKVRELEALHLSGYILKRDSPSCGMQRVRVYSDSAMPAKRGVGVFARVLMDRLPFLPVEEEGRLKDRTLRENFIVRVFCYQRWQEFMAGNWKVGHLVSFHTKHKLLLMAHHEPNARQLGRLVAQGHCLKRGELRDRYANLFFAALRHRSTAPKNAKVLQHILGHFKKQVDASDKKELLAAVEDYRRGWLPLIVPITLIKHYVDKFDIEDIKGQIYLNPHPKELMLRNHDVLPR